MHGHVDIFPGLLFYVSILDGGFQNAGAGHQDRDRSVPAPMRYASVASCDALSISPLSK